MRKGIAIFLNVILLVSLFGVFARASGVTLTNVSVLGDVSYQNVSGSDCIFLESLGTPLYLRASSQISENTTNVALRIVYLDKGSNYLWVQWNRQNGSTTNRLLHKSNSGEFREALVLIHTGKYNGSGSEGEDIKLYGYDTKNGVYSEWIKEIELISLDNIGSNEENGTKKHLLYQSCAHLLKKIGLFPEKDLTQKVTLSDVNTLFESVTGKPGSVTEPTMQGVLKSWLTTLGYPTSGNLQNKATEAGLVRSVGYAPRFYGYQAGRELQNFGIASVTLNLSQTVFYDDLAGLLYNLLFMKSAGEEEIFLVTLAKNNSDFKDKMLALNDYYFSNFYYHNAGIEISEKIYTDSLTGEKITQLTMKGGNVNSTYVNGFSSVDGENYVLCAAFDKRQAIGVPVVYNTKTKKTVELSRRGGIIQFAMLMSKQNIAYWTEGASLYSYNIQTQETKTVFTEPDGAKLQDVPTITNDGNYVTVFCGKENFSHPDTIYRINTQSGDYKVIVDAPWVKEQFGNAQNPHAGHIIINPEDPEIVNFLHGGGANVTDRLWLYDYGDIYQPYVQQMKEANNTYFGEHITHVFWSTDGKRLYFLRPPASSDSVENGITYLDMTEQGKLKTAHVLNGDYSYIHTSVDEGDKHFISDTQIVFDNGMYRNEIVLYSDVSNQAYLLAYVPVWKSHPCHSHPTFTGDWKKVVFNQLDEKTQNCAVAVMEVEERLSQLDSGALQQKGGIAWLEGENSSGMLPILPDRSNVVTYQGAKCLKITDSLNLEIFGSLIPAKENTVSVSVTYWDEGNNDFYLKYNTNSDSEYDGPKNKKQIAISKTNTNRWKTQTILLEDASFRSANADNTDLMLLVATGDTLYLKNFTAICGTENGFTYSKPQKNGAKYYLPFINATQDSKTVYAFMDTGADYRGTTARIMPGALTVLEILAEQYEKLFVWYENLKPIDRRESK